VPQKVPNKEDAAPTTSAMIPNAVVLPTRANGATLSFIPQLQVRLPVQAIQGSPPATGEAG
jgi:hypothetical protein